MFISDKIKNQTTQYAKAELSSYLVKIAGPLNDARIELDLIEGSDDHPLSDDRYIIEITDGNGYIKGSNSRSVLMGVYAYLKHLGCRFLRPGDKGEIIPKRDLDGSCSIDCADFYPYRIEVLEGAISEEIVIEVLKWLPKAGYNGYYIQYVTPYIFLKRWYTRELNPFREPEEFSYEDAKEVTLSIAKFAKKLGLQLWEMGHGFMFYPFGMNYGPEWTVKLSEEAKPHVALINGERDVRGGNIAYTNLCYTDPVVREKIAQYFVDFMKERPYVDALDVSLADGINNHCTCSECMKLSVSDVYVQMLNDIDAALTANNIDVKLKLCIYVNTRWAPEKLKLNNPARFINSVAAGRSYTVSYPTKPFEGEIPRDDRTSYTPYSGFEYSLRFMNEWQKLGDFDRIIFDYHLYAAHYFDFSSYLNISRVMAEDAKKLRQFGAHGIQNCKTQRAFMPTSLPIYSFGELLVDPDKDYEDIVEDYFTSAFGGYAKETQEYLNALAALINREILTTKIDVAVDGGATTDGKTDFAWKNNPKMASDFVQVPALVDEFLAEANEYLENENNETIKRSFEILYYHGEIMKRLSKALFFGAIGQSYVKAVAELRAYIMRNEDKFYMEFDAYLFIRRFINEVLFKDVPPDASACDCNCEGCGGCDK